VSDRCYVLGAGFSKAVADLPLMKKLVSKFKDIREHEKKLDHNLRVRWGDRLLSYIDYLENEFFRKPCIDIKNGETYRNCNFKENLEALVSFIDLNLSGHIHATRVDKTGKTSDYTKRCLFWNYADLDELRRCIQTYLYLALIGPSVETPLLRSFIEQLDQGDTLITFNYDLVVETALYSRRLWNPSDGYGLEFNTSRKVSASNQFQTQIALYKLHGSLNWKSTSELEYFYVNDGTPVFPGYLADERQPSRQYEGKHAGRWVMPSFSKDYSVPGLLTVWTKALDAVRRAEEVIIVGYSLPEADSAAGLLFGTTGISAKSVALIDPQAKSLCQRYGLITGNKGIKSYAGLSEYLEGRGDSAIST
jgi:hypothetical protein